MEAEQYICPTGITLNVLILHIKIPKNIYNGSLKPALLHLDAIVMPIMSNHLWMATFPGGRKVRKFRICCLSFYKIVIGSTTNRF